MKLNKYDLYVLASIILIYFNFITFEVWFGFFGVYLGILATFKTVYLQIENDRRKENKQKEEEKEKLEILYQKILELGLEQKKLEEIENLLYNTFNISLDELFPTEKKIYSDFFFSLINKLPYNIFFEKDNLFKILINIENIVANIKKLGEDKNEIRNILLSLKEDLTNEKKIEEETFNLYFKDYIVESCDTPNYLLLSRQIIKKLYKEKKQNNEQFNHFDIFIILEKHFILVSDKENKKEEFLDRISIAKRILRYLQYYGNNRNLDYKASLIFVYLETIEKTFKSLEDLRSYGKD